MPVPNRMRSCSGLLPSLQYLSAIASLIMTTGSAACVIARLRMIDPRAPESGAYGSNQVRSARKPYRRLPVLRFGARQCRKARPRGPATASRRTRRDFDTGNSADACQDCLARLRNGCSRTAARTTRFAWSKRCPPKIQAQRVLSAIEVRMRRPAPIMSTTASGNLDRDEQ